ncbi:MAG: fatty acid desaturase [Planctomycetes bacterium]|nr:fatty acid desaturase [Planctomycetota bacterium]
MPSGLQSNLKLLKQRSYRRGIGIFVFDACGYTLAMAGTIALPGPGQRIVSAVIAGLWTTGLLIVGHDACHHSLTPNRRLNRLLGTLAFLPALHTYSLWQYGHNHLHHLFTNRRGLDYVWEPLSLTEYQALSGPSKLWYRFFRTPVGHLFYYPLEIWWKRRFIPQPKYLGEIKTQYWIDFAIVTGWLVTLCMTALVLQSHVTVRSTGLPRWPETLVLTVFLPILVGQMVASTSEFIQHTHPDVHWYTEPALGDWTNRQAQTSVHCRFPGFLDRLSHWIMDHTAHHMQPSIPSYHLRKAQRSVETDRGDQVVTYHWSPRAVIEVLRVCKLYDDQAGCWTDYSGNPTSAARRPKQAAANTEVVRNAA